jgi:sn-glycerol 3-phosphate transport system permease protein
MTHVLLILSITVIGFPLYYAFVISTQSMQEVTQTPQKMWPSSYLWENYKLIWDRVQMGTLLLNSMIVALTVSLGKIVISILSAFAIVYFNFRGKQIFFWMIFVTLMLPVPVRIISTYQVISELGWVDTYAGLTIPLIASATATFLFRQFYLTIPDELVDAAKIDGSGPLRFLWSIILLFFQTRGRTSRLCLWLCSFTAGISISGPLW